MKKYLLSILSVLLFTLLPFTAAFNQPSKAYAAGSLNQDAAGVLRGVGTLIGFAFNPNTFTVFKNWMGDQLSKGNDPNVNQFNDYMNTLTMDPQTGKYTLPNDGWTKAIDVLKDFSSRPNIVLPYSPTPPTTSNLGTPQGGTFLSFTDKSGEMWIISGSVISITDNFTNWGVSVSGPVGTTGQWSIWYSYNNGQSWYAQYAWGNPYNGMGESFQAPWTNIAGNVSVSPANYIPPTTQTTNTTDVVTSSAVSSNWENITTDSNNVTTTKDSNNVTYYVNNYNMSVDPNNNDNNKPLSTTIYNQIFVSTASPVLTGPPASPVVITKGLSSSMEELDWEPVFGATGYKIYDSTKKLLDTITDNHYDISKLTPNVSYDYFVSAIDAAGESGLVPAHFTTLLNDDPSSYSVSNDTHSLLNYVQDVYGGIKLFMSNTVSTLQSLTDGTAGLVSFLKDFFSWLPTPYVNVLVAGFSIGFIAFFFRR